MPYMICKNCDVYYEIADENSVKDLKTCQCGSSMKYYDKLEDYLNSKSKIKERSIPLMKKLVEDYESAISRIILQSLSEIPIDLGIKRLMLVLKGKNSPFIFKYQLDRLKTYGFLTNFTEEQLRIIIDSLSEKGYIKSVYISEYEGSNLNLTEKGRKFLQLSDNLELGFMKKIIL